MSYTQCGVCGKPYDTEPTCECLEVMAEFHRQVNAVFTGDAPIDPLEDLL